MREMQGHRIGYQISLFAMQSFRYFESNSHIKCEYSSWSGDGTDLDHFRKGTITTIKGDQSENGPSGDLILKLNVSKHNRFRKLGDDIHTTEWITISQAALGTSRTV